jgi:hypothetical protein
MLVIMGACAGLCYNALWYFPVLIVIGGCVTVIWDLFGRKSVARVKGRLRRKEENPQRIAEESTAPEGSVRLEPLSSATGVERRPESAKSVPTQRDTGSSSPARRVPSNETDDTPQTAAPEVDTLTHAIPVKLGIAIIVGFFRKLHLPV